MESMVLMSYQFSDFLLQHRYLFHIQFDHRQDVKHERKKHDDAEKYKLVATVFIRI